MDNTVQRSFIIGDRWLYYKVYTGPKTADTVLKDVIKPITELLIQQNLIDKWFFIRYSDPKHHLRIRLHHTQEDNLGTIINTLHPYFKKLLNQDLIWKLQADTYLREIERYGHSTIELTESLFFHDSKMIVDFIDMIEGEHGEELRWLFSLRAIDSLLDCFNYSDKGKSQLLMRLSKGFLTEFGDSRHLRSQLGDKFRFERKKIDSFMTPSIDNNPDYEAVLKVLKVKEQSIKNIAQEILESKKNGNLSLELDDLMGSYIHMLMNRLFKSQGRKHELVCYDLLSRYYKSMIAKKRVLKILN